VSTSVIQTLLTTSLTESRTVRESNQIGATNVDIARLTRRLAAGDEEAFREFHARYFDRLYQFLLAVTGGREHEAQEALQQTLLRVARYVREHKSDEVFWGWLRAVARSAARDAGRKQKRYAALLERFEALWRDRAPERGAREEERLRDAVEQVLEELDPGDRRLIEGKYLEGATVKELCRDAGLTEKAVESRLLRLRRELRERMLKRIGRRI
jgi:RNA polymerase sigma-70 factor (ECF subfamily)